MLINSESFIAKKKEQIKKEVNLINDTLTLSIIQVGNNPASNSYIRNKIKFAEEVGITVNHVKLDETITQGKLVKKIKDINNESTSVLIQLPLPNHIDEKVITNAVDPLKDADGFHVNNIGKLWNGEESLNPCTAVGVSEWCEDILGDLTGLDVLIVNRSALIGRPLVKLLLDKNATVSIAHSKTKDLVNKMKNSDIVILGVGKDEFINEEIANEISGDKLKLIVDVSINVGNDGKLCGDFSKSLYDNVEQNRYSYSVTRSPKGCGPVTVCYLASNIIKCYKLQKMEE